MTAATNANTFQGLLEEISAALSDAVQLLEAGDKESTVALRQIDKTLAQALGADKADNAALVTALTASLKMLRVDVAATTVNVAAPAVNVVVQPAQVVFPKANQAKGWSIKFDVNGSGIPVGAKMMRID